MQKKLLTAAIGAVLTGPAFVAQADVTVYGSAQVEWAQVDNGSTYDAYGNPTTGVGTWNNSNTIPAGFTRSGLVDNNRGRFGIKANEDLGGGWTGLAHFEWKVDTADGVDGNTSTSGSVQNNDVLSDRVSTVGLSHKAIGTLRFGQDSSPYKISGVALDPFVTTTLEARNNYGMSGNRDGWGVANAHNNFWQDSLFFNSASFGGAYVNVALGLDRTGTDGSCNTFLGSNCDAAGRSNGKNNGDLDVAVGWKGDFGIGLHVFGGYTKLVNTTNLDEPTAMKLGAQLTIVKAHTVSLQYEATDRGSYTGGAFGGADEGQYLFLGYQGKFGPVTAVVQAGKFESGDFVGYSYEGNYLAIGAIYNLSKTFRVFGGLRKTELDFTNAGYTLRDEQVLSVGIRKDF